MEDEVPLDLGDVDSKDAHQQVADEAREPLDSAHKKRWYTRWKFWSFLGTTLSTAAAIGATIFAGMALRQARPDDPDYEAIKAARDQLQRWRELSDKAFWDGFTGYVRDTNMALETQTHMMNYVEMYFPSAFVPLMEGESIRLRRELVDAYYAHVAQGPDIPSLAIYQRLSQGMKGMRADTGQLSSDLPRAQCADLALVALTAIRKQKGE